MKVERFFLIFWYSQHVLVYNTLYYFRPRFCILSHVLYLAFKLQFHLQVLQTLCFLLFRKIFGMKMSRCCGLEIYISKDQCELKNRIVLIMSYLTNCYESVVVLFSRTNMSYVCWEYAHSFASFPSNDLYIFYLAA